MEKVITMEELLDNWIDREKESINYLYDIKWNPSKRKEYGSHNQIDKDIAKHQGAVDILFLLKEVIIKK